MALFQLEYVKDGSQEQFQFDSPAVSIGRDAAADFSLDHPTVSRQHAMVVQDGSGFHLMVLSESGFTAVNGDRVQGKISLHDGATLHIGQVQFVFRSEHAAAAAVEAPAEEERKPRATNMGVLTWDEIANSDEAMNEAGDNTAKSNYDLIKEAKQARSKKDGSSPIVPVGLVLIAAIGAWLVFGGGGGGGGGATGVVEDVKIEPMVFAEGEIDCVGVSDCRQQALQQYRVGAEFYDTQAVAVDNLFQGWRHLTKSQLLLDKAQLDVPDEISDLPEKTATAREGLDKRFRDFRVRFDQADKRNNYKKMAQALNTILAVYSDKGALENRWARKNIRKMKERGIFPKRMR
jgi:pSer/pThr/pTyr-binding forkhead associated (FHA) protein